MQSSRNFIKGEIEVMTHAARLILTWRIQWWYQFFQIWYRLRVINCFRGNNVNPDFFNNVPHFDFK